MSNEVSIFGQPGFVTSRERRGGRSELSKSVLSSRGASRRIQTGTNGTFKRIVNGEQVGNAVRGAINVIIVHFLPDVSRIFYASEYDPDAKATLPDCWSNLGDRPEDAASNRQSNSCASCPKNVEGSGSKGRGRACRYQRRIAILLEGDMSGDVYQFNVPAASLFGKSVGVMHSFENYYKYLDANHEDADGVVTEISYDLNADSMKLQFRVLRTLSDEEMDLVAEVQARPSTKQAAMLVVAARDGVTANPPKISAPTPQRPAAVQQTEMFPDTDGAEEPVNAPVRRQTKADPAPVSASVRSSLAEAVEAFGKD